MESLVIKQYPNSGQNMKDFENQVLFYAVILNIAVRTIQAQLNLKLSKQFWVTTIHIELSTMSQVTPKYDTLS